MALFSNRRKLEDLRARMERTREMAEFNNRLQSIADTLESISESISDSLDWVLTHPALTPKHEDVEQAKLHVCRWCDAHSCVRPSSIPEHPDPALYDGVLAKEERAAKYDAIASRRAAKR